MLLMLSGIISILPVLLPSAAAEHIFLNQFAVQLKHGDKANAEDIAREYGFLVKAEVSMDKCLFLFSISVKYIGQFRYSSRRRPIRPFQRPFPLVSSSTFLKIPIVKQPVHFSLDILEHHFEGVYIVKRLVQFFLWGILEHHFKYSYCQAIVHFSLVFQCQPI